MRISRRTFIASPLVAGVLTVPDFVVAQGVDGLPIGFEPIFDGLSSPVGYVDANDGSGRFFIVEQDGRVLVSNGGELLDTPFLDIRTTISTGSEQGLLSIALDPGFGDNGRVFVSFTDTEGDSQVVRYSVRADDPNQLDPETAVTILSLDQPYPNHNGGDIVFGPDGYLYLGFGDGGSQGDPENRAQNPSELLGKILRIDVGGDQEPYGIPADNPFVDDSSFAPEVFAWGLRNPWRLSFDRETGDLWIGDVGQSAIEEIDLIPTGTSGQNFGWNIFEGTECYAGECDESGLTMPVEQYTHEYGCSVTGGYVYRGASIPDLVGTYLFADYCTGYLWGLVPNGDGTYTATDFIETSMNPSSFAQDASGELYILDLNGGISRVVAG
ncbi:MAG: PQQ-dependent sugar dehydrogenase [Thermomicrobiales bacterium]|nr:PQQ-dependent sugar dehydrogenase [Thermomicrobiales bacterium]MCO5222051.1 PQQ-dependent sugar dehydrogenase [Thermomicrobiales bacterium]